MPNFFYTFKLLDEPNDINFAQVNNYTRHTYKHC